MLTVNGFGGGVALLGSADTRSIGEVLVADSVDIQPRGALVAASDRSPYLTLLDHGGSAWSQLLGFASISGWAKTQVLAVGVGADNRPASTYLFGLVDRQGELSPVAWVGGQIFGSADIAFFVVGGVGVGGFGTIPPVLAEGVLVTGLMFPGMFWVNFCVRGGAPVTGPQHLQLALVNLGAREGSAPRTAPGLYVVFVDPVAGTVIANCIEFFDALGTGSAGALAVPVIDGGEGSATGGGLAQQLFFRGVIAFNDHVFGWGFDSADLAAGDGPNRVMFSNLGQPLKWGNDNQGATATTRFFTDSDAIVLGDAGEIIRGAIKWNGKLWFGTNQQLHFIGGSSRDSFLTDGAIPVQKSFNIVGPYALLEGPDRLLYGVSDHGLWRFTGTAFDPLFLKLVDFRGQSNGYWDLIWSDATRAIGYPGKTNQDLVWMTRDLERRQVLVGIPFCDATAGFGVGADTVIVKYHVDTGGFTRQVFRGVTLTAALYEQRAGLQDAIRFLGTGTAGEATIERYADQPNPVTPPVMPGQRPVVEFGWYAPFGPNGAGVVQSIYCTLAWQDGALPLVFHLTTSVDERPVDDCTLSLQPTEPAHVVGALWLDTSETDPSIGNATATATIPARGGYLFKTWTGAAWQTIAGLGVQGTRVTLPLPLTRVSGVRYAIKLATTVAAGRFQFEGLGLDPGSGSDQA